MIMKRCVVIGGAPINNYEYIKKEINTNDFIIYCDSGLNHLKELNIKPNLIVGDFDSTDNPNVAIETIILPCEKDDTDTMYGVKEGLKRGFNEFLLIGVIGNRIDHTLGNISILLYLDKHSANGKIIDDYSEIELIKKEPKFIQDDFSYFSILSVGDIVNGLSIENAKYRLNEAQIVNYYPLGISNEVIKDSVAKVTIKEGMALLIKVF